MSKLEQIQEKLQVNYCNIKPGIWLELLSNLPSCKGRSVTSWGKEAVYTMSTQRGKPAQSPAVQLPCKDPKRKNSTAAKYNYFPFQRAEWHSIQRQHNSQAATMGNHWGFALMCQAGDIFYGQKQPSPPFQASSYTHGTQLFLPALEDKRCTSRPAVLAQTPVWEVRASSDTTAYNKIQMQCMFSWWVNSTWERTHLVLWPSHIGLSVKNWPASSAVVPINSATHHYPDREVTVQWCFIPTTEPPLERWQRPTWK